MKKAQVSISDRFELKLSRSFFYMGYNARNDEIHDNIVRMRCEWEAQRDAHADGLGTLRFAPPPRWSA
jgi:hypothetical protein